VTRRCFLEWSLLVGSALSSLPPSLLADSDPWGASLAPTPDGFGGASLAREASRILRVGCPSHNCGGRCLLKLHIENGVIVRIDTDDASADTMPKAVEPAGESRSDYQICADIAGRLNLREAFTEGRSERDWVDVALSSYRKSYPRLPSLREFETSNAGVHKVAVTKPAIAFEDFRRDPGRFPLSTPSGKIEIFSSALHALGNASEIPAVPKYIQEWESPFGAEARKYPLQVVGHHTLARVHSTMNGVDWLEEAFPHRVFVNQVDAAARSLANGDEVRVFNGRGELTIRCRVTRRIMPGVVAIPQGAWWAPTDTGLDRGGSVNVLTSERWTPLAFGNAQHTVMAEVVKA